MKPDQSPPGGAATSGRDGERGANDRQVVERRAALGALAEVRLRRGALGRRQLAVEIQLDRAAGLRGRSSCPASGRDVRVRSARARSRCTAACSWRLTVPSASPSASAISPSFSP